MANIKVLGKSLVVKSAMKKEDLETIKKYRPDALNLYEGEGDKKDIKFSVLLAKSGNGSIDKYGVAYAPDTTDADGLAEATIVLGNVGDDLKEFIADGQHAILLSSHIVSDIEKLCDSVAFLHRGTLKFCESRESLLAAHPGKTLEEIILDIAREERGR